MELQLDMVMLSGSRSHPAWLAETGFKKGRRDTQVVTLNAKAVGHLLPLPLCKGQHSGFAVVLSPRWGPQMVTATSMVSGQNKSSECKGKNLCCYLAPKSVSLPVPV